jgi:putative PIN family toxin of toxin-antitoxin system
VPALDVAGKAVRFARFVLVISAPILEKYRRVAREMTKARPLRILASILKIIELQSERVRTVSFARPLCTDPEDDKFVEAAIAAQADYVVSGDSALLKLKSDGGVQIVRPARFLKAVLL